MNFVTANKHQMVEKDSQLTIDTSISSYCPPLCCEEFSDSCFKNDERLCLNRLKRLCLEKHLEVPNHMVCRFAIFHGFNVKRAGKAIVKNQLHPSLHLRLEEELEDYLETTKIVFPIHGLKSVIGSEVMYMHPSRYLPSERNNRLLLDSMCYVLNDMNQTIDQCRNGILMIINMDGYKKKNFHRATYAKLTRIAEGQVVPARLIQILVVNPPKVFERIWKTIRPAFSPLFFSKKIQVIESNKLCNYLMDGYEEYLPDEFSALGKDTAEIVEDYIALKTREESSLR